MRLKQLQTQPGHLIRRAQQIAVAIFIEECAAFDLTPVQYAALVAIDEHEGIDATRLSAQIAFDRSTLGNVLERLEMRGLVERYPSRDDRRVKLLKLTDIGRAIMREAEAAVRRAQERILAPLDAERRRVLLDLLAQLVELNNDASRVPQRRIA
ncbi:MarR family winged helix-turn-helix transcriptional regulator [Pseudorhodoplanes sp.]|uniref:MarR family winged helix-turn-helix transcriptional regulator n=1 Tax=Pseudorhodoplanes sp. TaxID=1934341 RepID=UPI00391B90CC